MSVAGAHRLAVNGRTGGHVGLLQAGAAMREPRVADQLRLASGSQSHAEDRLAATSSRHAAGNVALTHHVAVDVAGLLSAVVCNCPAEDPAIAIKLDQEIVNSGYLINDWLDLVSLT